NPLESFATKLVLIEDGVDISPFRTVQFAAKDPILFLFVGRLAPNKRIDLLLKFFAHLRNIQPAAHLRIIGRDWDGLLADYRTLASDLALSGCVSFAGQLSDAELAQELS